MDRGTIDDGWGSFEVPNYGPDLIAPPAPAIQSSYQKNRLHLSEEVTGFELDWNERATKTLPKAWLGVDVGFIYPAVDSDGLIYRWSRRSYRLPGNSTGAGSVRVRKADGTTYIQPAYDDEDLADIYARARGERYRQNVRSLAYALINKAANSDRGVALEDWADFQRRRAAWVDLWRQIIQVAEKREIPYCTVPAAWTSTTCPECGYQSRANRPSRDTFQCKRCKHAGQADRIAARNIMAKADLRDTTQESLGQCRNRVCDRVVYRNGLCCPCYFYARRHERLPSQAKLEELRIAANYAQMKDDWLSGSLDAAGSAR